MSRVRQFARGVSSSWLATLATVTYSLFSVPIALRYLSAEEFGLFVLLLQIAAYFTLIEIGMSAATARILIDHKDHRDGGAYGSTILTGFLVFGIQSFIILAFGILAAPWIISLVAVPSELAEAAILLLRWLALASALTLAFRIYGSVLYANKRLDLVFGFMGANMIFGLALLAIILAAGAGLTGLRWLFLTQAGIGIILPILACHKLGLLPKKGHWDRPSMKRFRELFGFGKDIFLINVGNQVLEASQLIIVTRTMGLTAAAIWSVSTKLFTLVHQLVTKIEGTAIVFLAEMIVRGEKDELLTRFRQVYQLTAAIAVVALAPVVAINAPFVSVWANPSLAWSLPLSALFAVAVALNAVTRCSGSLIIHTKQIASFRYVYFLEALLFVLLSLWLSTHFGFYGILGASIACLLVFRATYTTWRMTRYFQLPARTFWWTWLKRPILAVIIMLPFVISSSWMANNISNLWGQLFISAAWVGLPAAITLIIVALPRDVRKEFALRWSQLSLVSKH
jgi:O-antigen/teichoic acid export membrane protein